MSCARTELLGKLQTHLQLVQEQPETLLDPKLLEQCDVYFSVADVPQAELDIWEALLYQIAEILPIIQQDPRPLLGVTLKLSVPLSFEHVNKLDLLPGLDLDAVTVHLVTLSLLVKATSNPAHVELVAGKPDLIAGILKLWLCADDAGTGNQAGRLLLDFLRMSKNIPEPSSPDGLAISYGQGPMWKRLFGDIDIFRLFFAICSLKSTASTPISLTTRQRTVAQARLMDWLPQVGLMDWDTLIRCHHADIVTDYGLEIGSGLLHFAAESMVDVDDDILMHISLLNFYSTLIRTIKKKTHAGMSKSLQYLVSRRVHHQIMSYWLSPDQSQPLEASYLSGPSAQYIATYASNYPEHFEGSGFTEIHSRLLSSLDLSAGRWVQGQSPKYELHILASVPRTFIFPSDATSQSFRSSVLSLIPCKNTNEDALRTLAAIFHGPASVAQGEDEIYPPQAEDISRKAEPARVHSGVEYEAAAALFWMYLSENSTFFIDLIAHAEIVVLKDKALAAISVMHAVATANWTADPSESTPDTVDTDASGGATQSRARIYAVTAANPSLPRTGIEALLYPAIRNVVFPYLLKPPKKLSGLVGGHGDAESAAYGIATAKHDLVKVVHNRLVKLAAENPDAVERSALARALRERVLAGPWGVDEEAGSRIATLDR